MNRTKRLELLAARGFRVATLRSLSNDELDEVLDSRQVYVPCTFTFAPTDMKAAADALWCCTPEQMRPWTYTEGRQVKDNHLVISSYDETGKWRYFHIYAGLMSCRGASVSILMNEDESYRDRVVVALRACGVEVE
jgi:hypothetical protein